MPANSRAHKGEKRKPGKSPMKRAELTGKKPAGKQLPERQRKHHAK
ncbi:hypothetical protein [Burkholderia cenocepacia]|nr:hypothetical protein [Burkholderia cenocepacia]MBR7969090.1 hypothetical protein [Burkholderia cenocepacia]